MLAASIWLWTEQRDVFNSTQCLQPGYDHEQNKETRSTTHNACSQHMTMNRTKRHVQQHMQLLQPVCDCEQNKKACSTARNTCNQCMTMNKPKRRVQTEHLQPANDYDYKQNKETYQCTTEQNKETCTTLAASVRLWTEQRDLHNTCSQWMATNRKKRLVQHLQPVYDYEQNKETCTTLAASGWLQTEKSCLLYTSDAADER